MRSTVEAHLQARVGPGGPGQEHGCAHELDGYHPRLAPAESKAVDRVHDGAPQQLEAVGVGRQREDADGCVGRLALEQKRPATLSPSSQSQVLEPSASAVWAFSPVCSGSSRVHGHQREKVRGAVKCGRHLVGASSNRVRYSIRNSSSWEVERQGRYPW